MSIDPNTSKKLKWNEFTALLRSKGYTSIGYENEANFRKPETDDWVSHHYGESCITVTASENLMMYYVLDSGD